MRKPSRAGRALIAVVIGCAAGALAWRFFTWSRYQTDFEFWWRGAGLLRDGWNPYHTTAWSAAWPLPDPLFYPLPAVLVTLPIAGLAVATAGALFMGISSGLLAWVVTRDGWWRLWLFASSSFLFALRVGQWSPLLVAAALLPAAGFVLVAKPTLGLALWIHRPTWRAAIGCAVVVGISLAVLPTWPLDWRANLARVVSHPAPASTLAGLPLTLALLRWRRPEARLLLAMAYVPQLLFFADQLPLWLVPRTRREAMMLSGCSWLALGGWVLASRADPRDVAGAAPFVTALLYLPCLVMILRRPNEGTVPAWLDRLLSGREAVDAQASMPVARPE